MQCSKLAWQTQCTSYGLWAQDTPEQLKGGETFLIHVYTSGKILQTQKLMTIHVVLKKYALFDQTPSPPSSYIGIFPSCKQPVSDIFWACF